MSKKGSAVKSSICLTCESHCFFFNSDIFYYILSLHACMYVCVSLIAYTFTKREEKKITFQCKFSSVRVQFIIENEYWVLCVQFFFISFYYYYKYCVYFYWTRRIGLDWIGLLWERVKKKPCLSLSICVYRIILLVFSFYHSSKIYFYLVRK